MAIWRNLEKNRSLINQAAASRAFIIFDTETTGLTVSGSDCGISSP